MSLSSRLQAHPFAVDAWFDQSAVLTYAVSAKQLEPLLPAPLQLDTWDKAPELGYVAVAMVQTRRLRPRGLPAFLGRDMTLIGYRIFVRYVDARGKRLRDLYVLGSDTDSPLLTLLGGLMTHYKYRTVDIRQERWPRHYQINSAAAGLHVDLELDKGSVLPKGSPFSTWKEARRFAGPMPFTFSFDAARRQVIIVEGVRENWKPQPVAVTAASVGFLDKPEFANAQLASAFWVQDIPYSWRKGTTETWTHA